MKNLFYLAAGVLLLASCEAQKMKTPPPPPPPAPVPSAMIAESMVTSVGPSSDRGVLMRNGTLLIMQDGQLVPVKTEIKLDNGDKILMNGDVIRANGSKTKLQEGMMIDKDGVMMDKDGNKVTSGR